MLSGPSSAHGGGMKGRGCGSQRKSSGGLLHVEVGEGASTDGHGVAPGALAARRNALPGGADVILGGAVPED